NPLHVRIEQRTDTRQRFHLGRKLVVAADRDDLWAGADGKQHFGQRRYQRHDARWRRFALRHRLRACGPEPHERGDDENQPFRTSNHRKNGPPNMAVMTPTGISIGANSVRAARSHTTRNAAPNSADAGRTRRWSTPTINRTRCGTTMPMKPIG